jgi:two-component system, NtrC family, response regulator
MSKILIIDDEQAVFRTLAVMIRRMGAEAEWCPTLNQGLSAVEENAFDVVLLDVQLPDGCGLDCVSRIRQAPSQPEVIILTGFGNVDGAEIAIKNGAWDYIQKSGSSQHITLSLKRVLEYRKEKALHRPVPMILDLDGIVGESQALKKCYGHLACAAAGHANVLISGETGTGKEIFARAIHDNSGRRTESLVVVDCAALPETLVESLLFGHEKGVYTGADKARDGLVRQADGGTLFLDEVGELPPTTQKVFLRVLQERKYRRVGGEKEIGSDFRLIAATNRNLDQMVETGRFRKDLLYRIRAINITLPPLRDRNEDVKLLALYYLTKICQRYGSAEKGFSPDFMDALQHYAWPGNVRELINALETAISNAGPEPTLYARHLPPDIRLQVIQESLDHTSCGSPDQKTEPGLKWEKSASLGTFKAFRKSAVHQLEEEYLQSLIAQSKKSVDKAMDISGLSRSRLYDLLKQHNLTF